MASGSDITAEGLPMLEVRIQQFLCAEDGKLLIMTVRYREWFYQNRELASRSWS
jgi:hypothetical protein